jgi:branched-chain amino acid aminotransferase
MQFISFNDEIIVANHLNFYQVERFRVADACFESMLYINGRIPLLSYHQERLNKTCQLLAYNSYHISLELIQLLLSKNKLNQKKARVRISLVRKAGFNYKPKGLAVHVLIEVSEIDEIFNSVNKLGLFKNFKKPINPLSQVKSANALIYVMALNYAQENSLDDVLIQNECNYWIEASSSNLFFIKNKQLFTSKEDSGCVLGVARIFLINLLGAQCVDITEKCLEEADEIFLSNAVQLIKPVITFRNRTLSTLETIKLMDRTEQKLAF